MDRPHCKQSGCGRIKSADATLARSPGILGSSILPSGTICIGYAGIRRWDVKGHGFAPAVKSATFKFNYFFSQQKYGCKGIRAGENPVFMFVRLCKKIVNAISTYVIRLE